METKEFQRWTAKRKVELRLQLIWGERKLVNVCREHDLKQSEVEAWMARRGEGRIPGSKGARSSGVWPMHWRCGRPRHESLPAKQGG